MSYYLTHLTYPIGFVAVLARQLCLPVPSLLFLLTGGALAGAGKLNFFGVLIVAMLGCVLADQVWFEAGRLHGKRVLRLLCALTAIPASASAGEGKSLPKKVSAFYSSPSLCLAWTASVLR